MTTINKQSFLQYIESLPNKQLIDEFNALNKNLIEDLINRADFGQTNDDENLNRLKKIAFMVNNSVPQKVICELFNDTMDVLSGKEKLYAQLLNDQDNLDIVVTLSDQATMKKLGIIELEENVSIKKNNSLDNQKVSWHVDDNTVANTWKNVDFVIGQIEKNKRNYKNWKKIIDINLWKDESSQKKLIDYAIVNNMLSIIIPEYIWGEEYILEKVRNDLAFSHRVLEKPLLEIYSKYKEIENGLKEFEDKLENERDFVNTNKFSDLSYRLYREISNCDSIKIAKKYNDLLNTSQGIIENKIEKQTVFKEIFKEEIEKIKQYKADIENFIENLNDAKWKEEKLENFYVSMENILKDKKWVKNHTKNLLIIYPYLSIELRQDIEIIELSLCNNVINNNIRKVIEAIPSDVYHNVDDLIIIWNKLSKENFSTYVYPFKEIVDCLSSTEKVIKFFNNIVISKKDEQDNFKVSDEAIKKLWDSLPQEFKKEKEVLLICMSKCTKIYSDLPKNLQKNKEVIQKCIETKIAGKVPLEYLVKIKEPHLIKEIIKQLNNYPHANSSVHIPESWKTRENIMLITDEHYFKNYQEDDWQKLTDGKIENYLTLLSNNREFYEKFPKKIKRNILVAQKYMEGLEYASIHEFPPMLWGNREFCLNAMTINTEYISSVPDYFWEDNLFVTHVCQMLDSADSQSKKEMLNYMPEKVVKFWNTLGIDADYNKFMLKFNLDQGLEKDKSETKKNKI